LRHSAGIEVPQPWRFSITLMPIGLPFLNRPEASLTGTPLSSACAAKVAMASTAPLGTGLPSRTAFTTSGLA
jgi:hypothetical protein